MKRRLIGSIIVGAVVALVGGKFLLDQRSDIEKQTVAMNAAATPYQLRPTGPIKVVQSGFSEDLMRELQSINSVTSVFDLMAPTLKDADAVAIMLTNWAAVDTEAPESLRASIRQQIDQVDDKRQVVFFTITSDQDKRKWPIVVFNQSAFAAEGVSTLCQAMVIHDLVFFWDGSPNSTASFKQSNARACVEQGWTALPDALQAMN